MTPKSSFDPLILAHAAWLSSIVLEDKIVREGAISKVVPLQVPIGGTLI